MKKREVFTVDEKRLKEIMAHETGADGSPKAAGTGKKAEETETVPAAGETGKCPASDPRGPSRKVPPISDRVARYRADYLSRRESVHRKQTYICYETYRRLARILPLLSEGMTEPAFLDNVLNAHLKQYEEELDEMVRLGTRNSF